MRQSLREAAFAALAVDAAGEPLGYVLMPSPALLGMLFVDPSAHRRGIAMRLWEAAREHVEHAHPEVRTIELNATPHALGFYRCAGFVPISGEFVLGGCRATRMACWLPARRLGAALH